MFAEKYCIFNKKLEMLLRLRFFYRKNNDTVAIFYITQLLKFIKKIGETSYSPYNCLTLMR